MLQGIFQGVSMSDIQIRIDGQWYDANVALVSLAWRWPENVSVNFRLHNGVVVFIERM